MDIGTVVNVNIEGTINNCLIVDWHSIYKLNYGDCFLSYWNGFEDDFHLYDKSILKNKEHSFGIWRRSERSSWVKDCVQFLIGDKKAWAYYQIEGEPKCVPLYW